MNVDKIVNLKNIDTYYINLSILIKLKNDFKGR